MKAPTQLRTERGYLKDMKLSVLHSTPRPGRITSLTSPNEAQENLHKQIGRSPIKDLPTAANVMYTIYAIALTIVFSYRRFYRRHFQCQNTSYVRTQVMSLPMHTECHFLRYDFLRYVSTHYVSTHYVSTYVMSLLMYTIIQFFDHTFDISIQPLEPICNLYAVNEGGK